MSKPSPGMATRLGTAVRIHVQPRPKNLYQSRPILDALKKFGEVNTFKNLRYDFLRVKATSVNRCIRVIFDDKEAAERAIAASPLKLPIPQSQSQLQSTNTSTSPSADTHSKWDASTIIRKRSSKRGAESADQEMICTIEPERHTESMTSSRTMFNVYNTRKKDNLILQDLQGPETNIPLPQLADTIRREGVNHYDKKRKPDPNAPTLMELYRESSTEATDSQNQRTKPVTVDEAKKSRESTSRQSGLKRLAKKKTDKAEANVAEVED